jgi:hypothetical protein
MKVNQELATIHAEEIIALAIAITTACASSNNHTELAMRRSGKIIRELTSRIISEAEMISAIAGTHECSPGDSSLKMQVG